MADALVVRNRAPSLMRRVWGALSRSADSPSMSDFSPFKTDGGWSIVTGQSPTSYERVGRNIRLKGFEENAVVSACIRTIADLVAPVALELYRENAKGEKTLDPSNPGQLVLDRPRVGWSANRVRQTTAAHLVGYGNALWVLTGPTDRLGNRIPGLPTGLRVVHPERLQYVFLDGDTLEPRQYNWTDRIGRIHETPWTDVIHFKDLTLDPDAIFGFPRGAAALLDMVMDGEASNYVRQIMTNNGSPATILGVKSVTTESQAQKADARWHELNVERGQRGRVRFIPNLEKVEQLGFTLRDLEFPDLRMIAREDICAAYGVDPRMISVASAKGADAGLSGTQYQEARRRLYLQTGAPLMTTIESELDLSFCPEFGEVKARFSPDDLSEITEDEEQTSQRVTREFQAGIVSREEARRSRNRPEKMLPTDHITIPRGTSVFTVQDADDTAAAAAERIINPPAPPTGTDVQPAAGDAPPPTRSRPAHPRIMQRSVTLSEEQKRVLWQSFDQRATKEEGAYRRTAVALFSAERHQVRAITEQHQRRQLGAVAQRDDQPPPATDEQIEALRHAIEEMYGERSDVYQTWVSRYLQLVRETMLSASRDLHASVDVAHVDNPRLAAATQARATRLAASVTRTTADQILGAIEAGHNAGMGMREIADLIDTSVFEGQSPARALTIARTESSGSLNEGEFVGAQATGVLQSHAWLSQRDADVRESHTECDAEGFVPMSAAFSNGLRFPGDPDGDAEDVINCRCAQLFSDETAE